MRKIVILICCLLFLLPCKVFANGAGLPPFFKINGELSTPNPLQLYGITAQSFLIPQDYAPENYVVDQPIDFQIDTTQLQTVIPQNLINNTKFTWDYGDGQKAEGLKNTHVYTKIGSYILVLTINVYTDPDQPPTQFIDSFLLNILPSKDYSGLPQAVIKMNGKQIKKSPNTSANVNFNNPISFDASLSKSSAPIIQYLWNFGDGETSNQKNILHKYKDGYFSVVVLRVKDSNGFISDAFVGLTNDGKVNNTSAANYMLQPSSPFPYIFLAVSILCLIIGFVLYFKKKKKK